MGGGGNTGESEGDLEERKEENCGKDIKVYKKDKIPYDYCFPTILKKYKILQQGIFDNTFSF